MTKPNQHKPTCQCGCGGKFKAGADDFKIDADNVLGLNNPWAKPPTDDDLKICKYCWFEARNGHAQGCRANKIADAFMNDKDRRILKLLEKGLTPEQVARKIGYGANLEEGIKRVELTIKNTKQ